MERSVPALLGLGRVSGLGMGMGMEMTIFFFIRLRCPKNFFSARLPGLGILPRYGLRDRPQLRLRAEVVVVVEPDKLPSPRKEVGSSPAVTPAARARTPSEPSAARTRSEPSAARDLRSNPAGQPLKKTYYIEG